MRDSTDPDSQTPQDLAVNAAHEYIKKTKEWADEDFHIEVLRTEGTDDAPVLVLEVAHHDDLKGIRKGGGKSVQLYVDVKKRSVINELAYQ